MSRRNRPYRVLAIGAVAGLNGVSTSMMNLYRNMDRSLVQWDFLCRKNLRIGNKSWLYEEEVRDLGGRIHYLDYSLETIPKWNRKRFCEILSSDPDLVGVHVHDIRGNVYPLIAADRLDKPVKVIQFHSGWSRTDIHENMRNASRSFKYRAGMISGSQYDRLACSDLAGMTGYLGHPFEILPNGVDLGRFRYNPIYRRLLRDQLGIPEDATVFGWVGTIYDIKNPIFALKVFEAYLKINPNAYYVFIGNGTDQKKVNDYIKNHRLKRRTRHINTQTQITMIYRPFIQI